MHKFSVLHVVPSLHPRAGGPSRTVMHLASAHGRQKLVVKLLCQGYMNEPTAIARDRGVDLSVVEPGLGFKKEFSLSIRGALEKIGINSPPNILHSHGVWHPVNHWASWASRRFNIPILIQPRGMLEPWAMKQKALKKRLAMAIYQRRDLAMASVLIATSHAEYENIRQLGFQQPIAVIPNGVELAVSSSVTRLHRSPSCDSRTVLFLSRIHPKKGVLNLIQAWARMAPTSWQLQIAGPDEAGHLKEVLALVNKLGLLDTVHYMGEIDGIAKTRLFDSADLFVLPTFSENFGVAVAEALAHGVPVITTRGAPWQDLITHDCGWWVDVGVEPLVAALSVAMGLSDEERLAMGKRGREYVRRYDWDVIARQTIAVYRWVLGNGEQPACLRLD